MKRLHVVGKSKDNKKLILAQRRDAKTGGFEVSISRKLLDALEDARPRTDDRRGMDADVTGVRLVPASPPPEVEAEASGDQPPIFLSDDGDELDIPVSPNPADDPVDELPPVMLAAPAEEPARPRVERVAPRRQRPEIPARSRLSPAEIQAMIRAGRGVRSVANAAKTPVAWVRYLAEPVLQERAGIVRQMLTARQERARLGPSALTIGEALVENLRGRGVRAPEQLLDEGFTASRPDSREWRVRLVLDHRGKRQVALWSYDPQTRVAEPLNSAASQLGWRRPPGQEDENGAARPRRTKSTGTSSRAKTKAARKKAKSSSRKKTTTRRSTGTRKAASRRTAASRSTRRSTTSRKTSARRSTRR